MRCMDATIGSESAQHEKFTAARKVYARRRTLRLTELGQRENVLITIEYPGSFLLAGTAH